MRKILLCDQRWVNTHREIYLLVVYNILSYNIVSMYDRSGFRHNYGGLNNATPAVAFYVKEKRSGLMYQPMSDKYIIHW